MNSKLVKVAVWDQHEEARLFVLFSPPSQLVSLVYQLATLVCQVPQVQPSQANHVVFPGRSEYPLLWVGVSQNNPSQNPLHTVSLSVRFVWCLLLPCEGLEQARSAPRWGSRSLFFKPIEEVQASHRL